MPGDPLKRVQAGNPLRISARTFNTMIDATEAWLASSRPRARSQPRQLHRQRELVRIRNDGAACPRCGVLGITGWIFGPDDNLAEFLGQPMLTGAEPAEADHSGRFAVTLEPIAAGKIGLAVLSGLAAVQINMAEDWHTFADVTAADNTQLISLPCGPATILATNATSGTTWGLVRLGSPGGQHEYLATLDEDLDYQDSASASCDTGGGSITVYDAFLGSGETVAADSQIIATWFADERKWYATAAPCS